MDNSTSSVGAAGNVAPRHKRWFWRAAAIFALSTGVGLVAVLATSPLISRPAPPLEYNAAVSFAYTLACVGALLVGSIAFTAFFTIAWRERMFWAIGIGLALGATSVAWITARGIGEEPALGFHPLIAVGRLYPWFLLASAGYGAMAIAATAASRAIRGRRKSGISG
jgi:hypothetical protein